MASRISPYVDNTGLVFAYDLANVNRSYLGQPTVNIMPYSEQFNSWGTGNVVLTANAAVAPNGTQTAYFFGADNVATYHYIYQYLTTESSTTYTFSCHVKPAGGFNGSTNTFFMQTNDGSWKNTSFNLDTLSASNNGTVIPLKDGWYRVSWTVAIATGGSLFWSMYPSPSPTAESQGGGYYIWGAQLEAKGHMTQYLLTGASTASRSVTQGLKDLTGNSTIDVTNVSFDSNAQMTFDGTNDLITLADAAHLKFSNGSFTVEQVLNISSISGKQRTFSKGSSGWTRGWHAAARPTQWEFELSDGVSTPGNSFLINTATTVGANHVVWVIESAVTAKLYVNGVQVGSTQTITESVDFATTTSTVGIGAFESGGEYFNGRIPYTRLYARALSASEIQQNFNAIKGRYGL